MGNISPFFFILSRQFFFFSLAFGIVFSGLIFTISLCAGPNKRVFWCILEKWELEQAFEVPLCLWIIGRLYSHYRAARFNASLNSGSVFVCVEIRPWGNGCCCWPWTKPRKNRLVLEPVCAGEAQREFACYSFCFILFMSVFQDWTGSESYWMQNILFHQVSGVYFSWLSCCCCSRSVHVSYGAKHNCVVHRG